MSSKNISSLATLLFLAAYIFSLSACGKSDVEKAKEFMEAGMYPQAMELLENRISEKPTDAEVHFRLGICEIYSGNYRSADERFASAVRLKSDYGFEIGEEYRQAGSAALDRGNVYRARELFGKAIQYNPDLKEGVVADCFAKGKECLDGKEYDNAEEYINLVLFFQPDRKIEIADHYYEASQKADSQADALALLRRCCESNREKYQTELGKKLLEVGNAQDSSDQRSQYIDEAAQYVDEQTILDSSLDYYTELRGESRQIVLTEKKWIEACKVEKGDTIYYLSLENFWSKKEKGERLYPASVRKECSARFQSTDMIGQDTPIWFSKNKKDTIVYYWVEKKD